MNVNPLEEREITDLAVDNFTLSLALNITKNHGSEELYYELEGLLDKYRTKTYELEKGYEMFSYDASSAKMLYSQLDFYSSINYVMANSKRFSKRKNYASIYELHIARLKESIEYLSDKRNVLKDDSDLYAVLSHAIRTLQYDCESRKLDLDAELDRIEEGAWNALENSDLAGHNEIDEEAIKLIGDEDDHFYDIIIAMVEIGEKPKKIFQTIISFMD